MSTYIDVIVQWKRLGGQSSKFQMHVIGHLKVYAIYIWINFQYYMAKK